MVVLGDAYLYKKKQEHYIKTFFSELQHNSFVSTDFHNASLTNNG